MLVAMQMRQLIKIILSIICLLFASPSFADSWIDPSWKRMLDSSDVIALVEYSSSGDFRASAKIVKIYKGKLNIDDEIMISGFSNRYGPVDKMSKGDRYIAFLNLSEPTEKRIEYWSKELIKNPELKNYVEALKNKKAFYVWSPTSGDLKVKGNKVQYDLIQSTLYKKQKFLSLSDFEIFLKAYSSPTTKNILSKELLKRIKTPKATYSRTQDLMKLYLLQISDYNTVYEKYTTVKNPSSRLALALLMGNINNEESKQVLITLLEDKHSLVQGEAVRQLSKSTPNEVGAVLLKKLKSANPYNSGPKNIMNPVMNRIDGGKVQIIKTLGDLGYKPAIPELLTMLETKNDNEFSLIVNTLRKLGTKEYAQYINKHLDSLHDKMILELCFIIRDDSLTECIPSLMNFVKRHDRTIWPTKECSISNYFGLALFKTDTVKKFLLADFIELMKMPNTNEESIDTKQVWVNEYILSFLDLKIRQPKNSLYDYMYDYYGFNSNFKLNPRYFQRKFEIEDSLSKLIENVLKPLEPEVKTTTVALIDNDFNLVNYSIKYQIPSSSNARDRLDSLNEIIINNTSITREHLVWSTGNYTGTNGAFVYERFGDSFMSNFLNYISTFSDKGDVEFMSNLKKYHYAKTDYEKETLKDYLKKAKSNNKE